MFWFWHKSGFLNFHSLVAKHLRLLFLLLWQSLLAQSKSFSGVLLATAFPTAPSASGTKSDFPSRYLTKNCTLLQHLVKIENPSITTEQTQKASIAIMKRLALIQLVAPHSLLQTKCALLQVKSGTTYVCLYLFRLRLTRNNSLFGH